MRVLGKDKLTAFITRYPRAENPLLAWKRLIESNDFQHFPDLKRTFGSADYDKPDTIFDIGGNKYRLIAVVDYEAKTVAIREVLTHEEYDER